MSGLLYYNKQEEKKAKLKHVQACLLSESQYIKSAGFDEIELSNESAAGLSLHEISVSTDFLGKTLKAPIMIAPMTGGTDLSGVLNERFAKAAEYFQIPFGVGSQRLALMDESVRKSFMIRKYAPSALVFANLGAAQIIMDETLALKAVEMIDADALFIHLNPMQEAVKEKGDRSFCGLIKAISRAVELLSHHKVPVFVREVGFGLSKNAVKSLLTTGIYGLDCAVAGGTSWTKVEALCSDKEEVKRLGHLFGEWGIPTAQSIKNVRAIHNTIPLIATGGIRSGLDVAKAVVLGANVAAMAQPMLIHAMDSEEALFIFIEEIILQLRVTMFAHGARTIKNLL